MYELVLYFPLPKLKAFDITGLRFIERQTTPFLPQVRLYVLAIAFSLAFGALFSKTWRVHKIFTAQRAIKKKVRYCYVPIINTHCTPSPHSHLISWPV